MVFLHHALHVPLAWNGVDLFFILSGYLITGILLRDRESMGFGKMLGRFYLRRAERILPPYVIALVLIVWLFPVDWAHLWPYYTFFLQNVPYAFQFGGYTPLVPMWSLAVEQHFYLVWPLLVFFLPRRWLAPCMLLLLAATPILRAACTPFLPHPETIYALTPFRLDALAAGALAALWLPKVASEEAARTTVRWAQGSMLLGAVLFVVLGLHPWFRREANTPIFNGLAYSLNLLVLGGLFVWATLERSSWLIRALSLSWLRGLGRVSYMFYLLQLGVLMVLEPRVERLWLRAIIAFLVTIGLATLSWFAVERPILNLRARQRRLRTAGA
jgi:peptidoglycan/LPS O-acetylase OafA/YrhL